MEVTQFSEVWDIAFCSLLAVHAIKKILFPLRDLIKRQTSHRTNKNHIFLCHLSLKAKNAANNQPVERSSSKLKSGNQKKTKASFFCGNKNHQVRKTWWNWFWHFRSSWALSFTLCWPANFGQLAKYASASAIIINRHQHVSSLNSLWWTRASELILD